MSHSVTYIAFLRGINVGGHKKVPMADLRQQMEKIGFNRITTILNSGNVIFQTSSEKEDALESVIAQELSSHFGFPVPVIVREADVISDLLQRNPFHAIEVTKDIRLYVSFMKDEPSTELVLPFISEDSSFHILEVQDRIICSVLDLSISQTPKGMDALEQLFGKNITTRNWNTLQRIARKLN